MDSVGSVYRTGCGSGERIGVVPVGESIERRNCRSFDRGDLGRQHLEVELGQLETKTSRTAIEVGLAIEREPVPERPDATRLGPAECIDIVNRDAPDPAFVAQLRIGQRPQARLDEVDARMEGVSSFWFPVSRLFCSPAGLRQQAPTARLLDFSLARLSRSSRIVVPGP
jgi:hypothetical protein